MSIAVCIHLWGIVGMLLAIPFIDRNRAPRFLAFLEDPIPKTKKGLLKFCPKLLLFFILIGPHLTLLVVLLYGLHLLGPERVDAYLDLLEGRSDKVKGHYTRLKKSICFFSEQRKRIEQCMRTNVLTEK